MVIALPADAATLCFTAITVTLLQNTQEKDISSERIPHYLQITPSSPSIRNSPPQYFNKVCSLSCQHLNASHHV